MIKINIVRKKQKVLRWLKKMSFDMRFIDESHNGGTTELAQENIRILWKNRFYSPDYSNIF